MILPAAADGFVWRSTPYGPALVCEPLEMIAPHLFTTRHWRLGQNADARGEDQAWHEVTHALGATSVARLRQVHGATVVVADKALDGCPEADALVGSDPEVALAVQAADCVPLLMADRRTGAVAAVHAGWRGLASGAPGAAVEALARRFDVRPRDLVAAIGPSIGACCYEVGPDVMDQFARLGPRGSDQWFAKRPANSEANPARHMTSGGPDKRFLDLWASAAHLLRAAGLEPGQIWVAGLCTASHPATLCSFRREGQAAGRIVAAIRASG